MVFVCVFDIIFIQITGLFLSRNISKKVKYATRFSSIS